MPKIKVPSNVKLADNQGNPIKNAEGFPVELEFAKDFLLGTVINDQKFGKNVEWLRAAIFVSEAFTGAAAGTEVLVSQDVLDKLKDVVSEPTTPYNVLVMRQAGNFIDAILSPEKN